MLLKTVLIYGLINSTVFALIAMGFSLTFGISGIANFAYGAFYLASGYITWMILHHLGLPFVLASLFSVLITGVVGFLTYWVVLLRVRGMELSEVIATFALGVGILEFFRWKGFVTYEFALPNIVTGTVFIAGVPVDYQRILILLFGIILLIFLYLFTHYTRMGLSFRGIAQDERTAIALGMDSDWIGALSMGFGSALAAVAATVILPLGIITINTGYDVLLMAIAVGIVGGLESTAGIIAGSLVLGYAQALVSMYLSPQWMMVVYLAAIVVILVVKPSGLFGKLKELEERV